VFDDLRPGRVQAAIWVAAFDNTRLSCARCNDQLYGRDVAIYSRTRPGDPFDPWCSSCAHELVRWAGAGALALDVFETKEAESKMKGLLHRGDW
jgi:hypothetical protein